MNTREKIISESLNLFSRKGFEAISVRDIAKAVGIKASSLYNHFKNKQDIFDTIIQKYSDLVNKFLNNIKIRDNSDENLPNKTNWLSDEYFFKKSSYIFNFYLEDENMIKFRKLLTIEQCNNSKLSDLYNKIFIDDILDFQADVFSKLISSNVFIKKDPYTLALQFYSPVFLLFYKHENLTDKERRFLENHISEFKDTYIVKG